MTIRKRRITLLVAIKGEVAKTRFETPLVKTLVPKSFAKGKKILHLDPIDSGDRHLNFIRIPVMARTEWGAKRKVGKAVAIKAKYLEFVI